MEIPIKISVPHYNSHEVSENLFGLGGKEDNPEIIKILGKDARKTNTSVTLSDGIVLGQPSTPKMKKAIESFHAEQWFDWNLALFIADKVLTLGVNSFAITDSILARISPTQFKIELNGKEITTRDELQTTLDEYIKSHSS